MMHWLAVALAASGFGEIDREGIDRLQIQQVAPQARVTAAPRQSNLSITFDRPVARESVTPLGSFWAFGRWSGTVRGRFSFTDNDRTVTLVPDRPLAAGEQVMVIVSNALRGADGSAFRTSGYSWQFWIETKAASLSFEEVVTHTTNEAGESSRPYGGIATDLNADGWLDITLVNEDTADLRVFINSGDPGAPFGPFERPTSAVGNRASPSEPSDFNRDGNVDIAVANINDNTVSVLLGNGDGTFGEQQIISVGDAPRGLAVLDVDGDGDTDIVNTNAQSDDMAMLINDGSGRFGNATFFDAMPGGEWALAAGDMNEDGLLDLVIGAQGSQQIGVQTANGDGSFTAQSSRALGGEVWMLVLGDVDGDGHEDVATVNSFSNTGSILTGNGDGHLSAPVTFASDPFPLAADLGDLDGDGDLDWVTSSFSGDWLLYLNDGAGNFAVTQRFDAPVAASCSLLFDFDNDLDLDLALVDEEADTLTVMRNGGVGEDVFQINAALSGAWFNPATPGQGVTIEVLPSSSQLFLAWFTFEAAAAAKVGDPNQRWLTAQGRYFEDTGNLDISLTRGGAFDDPTPVSNASAGEMTVRFSDCENGTVEYMLSESGRSGSFPIQRIASDNVHACSLADEALRSN